MAALNSCQVYGRLREDVKENFRACTHCGKLICQHCQHRCHHCKRMICDSCMTPLGWNKLPHCPDCRNKG